VPLVSGVCRTASAPTLSHGGSRLNASKPEANPKTRCPPKIKNFGFTFEVSTPRCGETVLQTRGTKKIHTTIESPSKQSGALLPSLAPSISMITRSSKIQIHRRQTFHTPNARDGNPIKATTKTLTSLSKRENMHGLA